jgi:iron complex transport system ATP-binding protein
LTLAIKPGTRPRYTASIPIPPAALRFTDVDLVRDGTRVLAGVGWRVEAGQRWAVLGPNGAGKTTLLRLASGYVHPTRGTVEVLGQRLGRVDVRALRLRIGVVSASVARMLFPRLTAREVVVSARHGALEPWWHTYSDADQAKASSLLSAAGFGPIAGRPFGVLSEGERQQVLLARTLMADPELLLLDEPCAGLDVAGRERLLARISSLGGSSPELPIVMVTHHVEEIPSGFTHVLLLRAGRVMTAGPVREALSSASLSECFGMGLVLGGEAGRWTCRAAG